MSSSKRGGKPFSSGTTDPLPTRKSTSGVSNPGAVQLSQGFSDMSLDSSNDGGWEVYARKSKNKAGSSASKPWTSHNSNAKAWGQPRGPDTRGSARSPSSSSKGSESNHVAPPPAIPPPLEHGWKWSSRPASSQSSEYGTKKGADCENVKADGVDDDRDSDEADATDDDLLSDDFDSDDSQKSHETRKKNRWFKQFFKILDDLTVEQINEPERQWHCPACQGGPGAIFWYRGLQPLLSHAKTKGSKRAQLHRELAELLDEELRRRGTSVIPAGEVYGKWQGLREANIDKEIVWPPMVIIMNTRYDKDENEKWIGMGNQELLDYFESYYAVKARHSYGPQGHRGVSVLIFEASAVGYLEAERLSAHFKENGKDREAWDRNRVPFYPGGKRQLYGYLADKRDLDHFNQHAQGKSKLKYDMRSYEEMVVSQMKQMSEDNQQLIWFKDKVAKEQKLSKALEESLGLVTEKLSKTLEENRIVRQRTKLHHEQIKEEMDFLEQFFKDQIQIIHEARDAKEGNFEKIQQEEREKMKNTDKNPCVRGEEVAKLIKVQDKEMEEFEMEREKLIKIHEEKVVAMKRRHGEEEVDLEKEFDAELNQLMEKYTPTSI